MTKNVWVRKHRFDYIRHAENPRLKHNGITNNS
ncbi:hypothetical protein CARN8_2270006 [mine drainage metagenome]|uniref:Uncharacterized protein n=1 Tax=mine drainage metagenome TaxID=410659 RepID=A0A3P3ZNB5_9ZZZZ